MLRSGTEACYRKGNSWELIFKKPLAYKDKTGFAPVAKNQRSFFVFYPDKPAGQSLYVCVRMLDYTTVT